MKILTIICVIIFLNVANNVEAKSNSQVFQENMYKLRESLKNEKYHAQSVVENSFKNQKKIDEYNPADLEMLPNLSKYIKEKYPKLDTKKLFKNK